MIQLVVYVLLSAKRAAYSHKSIAIDSDGNGTQQSTCGVIREGVVADIRLNISTKFRQTLSRISALFPDAINLDLENGLFVNGAFIRSKVRN